MKKFIVIGAVAAVLTVGGVSFAMQSDQPVKEKQASFQRSETVNEPLADSNTQDTVQAPEVKTDNVSPVQNQPAATQTAPQTAPAVQEEPFDAQLYGMSLLQEKQRGGVNMNAECYNKLMVESTGWNITKAQVDSAFAKVLGYSSTCAAYATFQATGNF